MFCHQDYLSLDQEAQDYLQKARLRNCGQSLKKAGIQQTDEICKKILLICIVGIVGLFEACGSLNRRGEFNSLVTDVSSTPYQL